MDFSYRSVGSSASCERKNNDKQLSGVKKISRKNGDDMTDQSYLYGSRELGSLCRNWLERWRPKGYQRITRKRLESPKMLKEMLVKLADEFPYSKSLFQALGYIISGFHITGLSVLCPCGHVSLMQYSSRLRFPDNIEELPTKKHIPITNLVHNVNRIILQNIYIMNNGNHLPSLSPTPATTITPYFTSENDDDSSDGEECSLKRRK